MATEEDVGRDDEADRGTKKRKRMDQLIAMSMGLAHSQDSSYSPSRDAGGLKTHAVNDHDPTTTCVAAGSRSRTVVKKHTWTPEEDALLLQLVQKLGHDWSAIAKHLPHRDRKRCRERFINHLDPSLSHSPWTHDEDALLHRLYSEIGSQWAKIASSVRGRSPDDCKNRWLHLSGNGEEDELRRTAHRQPAQPWTPSEIDALRSLVDANGAKDWFFVASQIPGRTDLQCRQQWHRVLAPSIVKGRGAWTPAEDAVLKAKVEELGPRWEQIAASLPGRLGKQCRERFINHLDTSINKTAWTAEEDATLAQQYVLSPQRWTKIASALPGRPENAVKNRWHSMRRRKSSEAHSGETSREGNTLR